MNGTTLENGIQEVLQRQAAAVLVPPPDPRSVLEARLQPADGGAGRGRHRLLLVAVTAAIAALVGGAAIRWASPGTVTDGPAAEPPPVPELDRPVELDTEVGVQLRAAELVVDVGGRRFSPTGNEVEVRGDPGQPATDGEQGYTTLELTWFEQGVEMRVFLYFASDGTDWWIDEIRTYDGESPGEWITMLGEYARSPIGEPFVGDLDAGPLHIGGSVLEAFVPRASTCTGTGRPGELHLELSGPRPVTGPFVPGTATGYATTIAVLDASTCEAAEPDGLVFRATVADPGVAAIDDGNPVFDPGRGPGEVNLSISFTGVGETTVTVDAVEQRTGEVVASLDLPVTVTR